MIIDTHAHLEPRMLDISRMVEKLDAAGIDKVVLIPAMNDLLPATPERLLAIMRWLMQRGWGRPITNVVHRMTLTRTGDLRLNGQTTRIYSRPDNDTVVHILNEYPERFLGWIFLNPKNYADGSSKHIIDDLESYRAHPGMVGIKLHPHWHDYKTACLGPILTRANDLELPVLIHLGFGKRGDFRSLCEQYPKVRFIAAHAGFPFYQFLWNQASRYRNLWVDLSSPYIDEAIARAAVKTLGPERCLYGTDAPYGFELSGACTHTHNYDYTEIRGWVVRLPISGRAKDCIFSGNAQEVLRLG